MRKWIDILCETSLNDVTPQAVSALYSSDSEPDLAKLRVDYDDYGTDISTEDYTREIKALKKSLLRYSHGPITLYRGLMVGEESYDLKSIGTHWTLLEEPLFAANILITAQVPQEAIDWVKTIARGIHWWDEEAEITLIKGKRITVTQIYDLNEEKVIVGEPVEGII